MAREGKQGDKPRELWWWRLSELREGETSLCPAKHVREGARPRFDAAAIGILGRVAARRAASEEVFVHDA